MEECGQECEKGDSLAPASVPLDRIFKYVYIEHTHTKPFTTFFSFMLPAKNFDDNITQQTLTE
jgi:hypothetical protein